MSLKEKAYELRQRRAKLLEESRELVEKSEKENRAMTPAEAARYRDLTGDETKDGELMDLAKRISAIERQLGIDAQDEERDDDDEERDEDEDRDDDEDGERGRRRGRSERRSEQSGRSERSKAVWGQRPGHGPLPHEDRRNVGRRHRYSLMKAIRQMASKGAEPLDGIELEVSRELELRSGKLAQGFMMPHRTGGPLTDRERRALDSGTGAGSVPTVLSGDWIELLRNKTRVIEAGAVQVTDLQGRFAIPRQSAAASAYWVAESGAPTGSNQVLDQVVFTPRTIGAFTDISRRFFELSLLQSGEEFVKQDLTSILARGTDLAALNGPGTSVTPLGIMQNTGITASRTVSGGPNGLAPTFANLVAMTTIVNRGNAADLGPGSYLFNADVRGTLATTAKIGSTFPIFLLEDDKVFGYPTYSTQQLPNNLTKGSGTNLSPIIFGIWNQLIMAYWSGVDILVDPYTGSNTGTVRIVALQDMDIQVRHNEAFSVMVDVITNQG